MPDLTRAELAHLRARVLDDGFMNGGDLSRADKLALLSAAESRLAMLDALSAERALEIDARCRNAYGWGIPELRAYALAVKEGAGE